MLLLLESFIVASTVVITLLGVVNGAGVGQVGRGMSGFGWLKAFTNLSNILNAAGAAVVLVFAVDNLFSGRDYIPRWAFVFRFVCAAAVGLTFLTVLVFLAPLQALEGKGYFRFFSGSMFFFHFLNPVLSAVSVIFLIRRFRIGIRERLLALVPTFIYSWLYFFMVVVFSAWEDFYGFTFGGRMYLCPVSFILMYGFTWLIALFYAKLHNKKVVAAE